MTVGTYLRNNVGIKIQSLKSNLWHKWTPKNRIFLLKRKENGAFIGCLLSDHCTIYIQLFPSLISCIAGRRTEIQAVSKMCLTSQHVGVTMRAGLGTGRLERRAWSLILFLVFYSSNRKNPGWANSYCTCVERWSLPSSTSRKNPENIHGNSHSYPHPHSPVKDTTQYLLQFKNTEGHEKIKEKKPTKNKEKI